MVVGGGECGIILPQVLVRSNENSVLTFSSKADSKSVLGVLAGAASMG